VTPLDIIKRIDRQTVDRACTLITDKKHIPNVAARKLISVERTAGPFGSVMLLSIAAIAVFAIFLLSFLFS
jgi:hypothetical protein